MSNIDNAGNRLGLTFHRSFYLNRGGIKQILDVVNNFGLLSKQLIQENTNLGSIYIQSMPRYGFGSGLLSEDYHLTTFGSTVILFDPNLTNISTQWLMHYYLSAPHGPGPLFWHQVVKALFTPERSFSKREIEERIKASLRTEGKELAEESVQDTANAFIGSYLRLEGLANLNVFQQAGENQYITQNPVPVNPWVMAVALIDYWQAQFPGQRQVNIDDLIDGNDFTRIFMCGTRRMNRLLDAMQAEGYLDLYYASPPYGAVLLRTDTQDLFQKIYTNDESL